MYLGNDYMSDQDGNKPQSTAYSKALGWLARREHSERELKRKLAHKGIEKEDADTALDKLKNQRYQSDERFAGAVIRTRIGQGYGPRRIFLELRGHGVTEAEIRTLMEDEAPDWEALAQSQYRRRYGGRPASDFAERTKRAQFLLRRGFDAATVRLITQAEGVDDSVDEFE